MLKVIVFNGPPRSAKGEAAKYMVNTINNVGGFLPAYQREFKDELFKITAATLGVSVKDFMVGYDIDCTTNAFCKKTAYDLESIYLSNPVKFRWFKDIPLYKINNTTMSKREALIHVSENVIKPFFGQDAFGQMAANDLPEEGVVFFSDSGFAEELRPIIEKVGEENILVVRVHREGCTFEGDSRDYLQPEMFDNQLKFVDLENNSTLEDFFVKVEDTVGRWMND